MIKKFLITIGSAALLSYLLILTRFNNEFIQINILDATFVVGMVYFFMGLLTVTNATKVFSSTGFALKTLFSPKRRSQHLSFYDYRIQKEKDKNRTTGFPALIVGFLIILMDLIMSGPL